MKTIDIHTHGIGGYDTKTITPEHILKIAEIHGAHGVSEILPAIYPASIEEMRGNMAAVKLAMKRRSSESGYPIAGRRSEELDNSKLSDNPASRILGAHLEGPFLNTSQCGALDPASFLNPTVDNLKRLIEGFEDIVKIITIAPEMDGATQLIRTIADMGIIVSMGHSNATYAEAQAGFNAGAKGITHIFNAMRGFLQREPGIAGFGLMNRHIYIEVIVDPYHLHPETIRLIFTVKSPEKIIIISDSVKETLNTQNAKLDTEFQAITDSHERLQGGLMTIVESAKRLINMGYNEDIITDCITRNPALYLQSDTR